MRARPIINNAINLNDLFINKFINLHMRLTSWVGLAMLAGMVSLNSCYYDAEDELYATDAACDTSATVSYASHIAPLMASYCNSCHSATSPADGVTTENYSGMATVALNGRLYGSVSHAANYKAMPQGGGKLPDCDIAKIKKWVDAGAPNN